MSPRYEYASLFMKYHSILAMPSAVFCQGGSSAKGVEGSCSFSFPSFLLVGYWIWKGFRLACMLFVIFFFPFSLFGGEVGGERCCS